MHAMHILKQITFHFPLVTDFCNVCADISSELKVLQDTITITACAKYEKCNPSAFSTNSGDMHWHYDHKI